MQLHWLFAAGGRPSCWVPRSRRADRRHGAACAGLSKQPHAIRVVPALEGMSVRPGWPSPHVFCSSSSMDRSKLHREEKAVVVF